ncbi:hypothetical protein GC096_32830 [Paenibacillus sp. LMG 31461]|uniref:DinB-like domain-containing protein n=1 Tax=Paenibacillus plantarum TaxID=2654975 RepID=A0ABX1XLV4_9BACL|nr:DinB family protein [Paenibacillus plantarum]NOU68809.1 hypothetical protein [Paenibacillus plantarum]
MTEEQSYIIPVGFNNHVWWNAGHIWVAWDGMTFSYLNEDRKLSSIHYRMFKKGTSPSEWNEASPSYNEIQEQLKNQIEEVINSCRGKLDNPLAMPFIPRINTIGKMLKFLIKEETHHFNVIFKIKGSIEQQQNKFSEGLLS